MLRVKKNIQEIGFENIELHSEVRKYKFYCEELENKLKLKNNYFPISKKVTPKIKDQVEQMIKNGMTYRDIAKQINISIKTISRIKNGYYDD